MGLCEEKRTLDPQIQDRRYELPPVGMVVGGKRGPGGARFPEVREGLIQG